MPAAPLKVAIAGASGLIGISLADSLETEGHTVLRLSRDVSCSPSPFTGMGDGVGCAIPRNLVFWNPRTGEIDASALEGLDAVINLAGRNLTQGRWSASVKRDLYDSRVLSTRLLSRTLASLQSPPRVLISASAVGIYPSSRTAVHTEDSALGTDFLAALCLDWEEATRPASEAGIRTVNLRTGIVLSKRGGMLGKVLPIFRLGLGGPIGDGGQFLSWIALHDLLALIRQVISDDRFCGPINAVSETPVTNRKFTKTLASALRRPAILPVPAFVVSLLFGEMGRQTLLASQNVVPKCLKDLNFHWIHSDIKAFLLSELD